MSEQKNFLSAVKRSAVKNFLSAVTDLRSKSFFWSAVTDLQSKIFYLRSTICGQEKIFYLRSMICGQNYTAWKLYLYSKYPIFRILHIVPDASWGCMISIQNDQGTYTNKIPSLTSPRNQPEKMAQNCVSLVKFNKNFKFFNQIESKLPRNFDFRDSKILKLDPPWIHW